MSSQLGMTTAAAIVNIFCTKNRLTPVYTVVQENTIIKNKQISPKFMATLVVKDQQFQGIGSTKKQAKQIAAQAFIETLNKSNGTVIDLNLVNPTEFCVQNKNNKVGELLEYCTKNILPHPAYDFIANDGGDTSSGRPEKGFRCQVKVGELTEYGVSRTKQEAKHQAANGMLRVLKNMREVKNMETVPEIVSSTGSNNHLHTEKTKDITPNKAGEVAAQSEQAHWVDDAPYLRREYLNFHVLKERSPLLGTLKDNRLTGNPESILEEIANDLELQVDYIPLNKPGKIGVSMCVPSFICGGVGNNKREAALMAVEGLCNYLKNIK